MGKGIGIIDGLGALIRADGFGYACAGDPRKAAELAYRDAYLTHRRNGIYGEMLFAAAIAAAAIAPGCNSDGCTEMRSAMPIAQLRNSATGEVATLDSLDIHGIGVAGDSLLVSAGTAVSKQYLPLRYSASSVRWCIAYRYAGLDNDRLNDTLTLTYTSSPWLADDDCGAMYRYTITGATSTTHLIDSVSVVQAEVTNLEDVNLNIYFRISEQ